MRRKLLLAALFVLPVSILLPFMDRYPFHPGSEFSDLMVSHYPNALYLQRSLSENHAIPLWSPLILSGYPFAANPLSGLFYPPGWLALLFPLNWGFNLAIVLHLVWGGVGLYLFLRSEGLPEKAAVFGALLFESMPKLYAHLASGHLTLLYAVPWTPWLFLAENRARKAGSPWRFAGPGLVLGMIALADVRWAAYAGLGYVAWAFLNACSSGLHAVVREFAPRLAANLITACLCAAPVLLPLFEYTGLSTRAQMLPGENLIDSLSPAQWLGLLYPYLRGPAETTLYPGGLVVGLFALALFFPAWRGRCGFWLAAIPVTLVFALGSHLPPVAWLLGLPGLSLLRVPPRVLFFSGMAFAIVGAYVFNALAEGASERQTGRRAIWTLALFSLAAFALLFGLAAVFFIDQARVKAQFAWGVIVMLLSLALLVWLARRKQMPQLAPVLLFVLALADLSAFNAVGLEYRSPERALADPAGAAAFLAAKGGTDLFRVYSPSYSLPQQAAAWHRLELADGVDPLILSGYQAFMEPASGVPTRGYSVTLPPFAEDPSTDNQAYTPDAALLGLLNVRYIASAFDLSGSDFNLLARKGRTRIYENLRALPRAWVQDGAAPPGQSLLTVPEIQWGPNQITLRASGPGLLVLSEILYPGWVARVDGQAVEIQEVGGLLRGVFLEAGIHQVIFSFRPLSVVVGAAVGATIWLAAGLAAIVTLGAWKRDHTAL